MQYAKATSTAAGKYFQDIRRFPMLKAEEEYRLAARWREGGDAGAADQLLTSHLRLVAKIAMGYRRYGLPSSDLISEGNVGLIEAVRRFEPEKGVRFSTYAIWWIKAAIQNYILRSWSLVKLGTTVNQKKLFFNLAKSKQRVSAFQEGDLRPEQVALIASGLGVTEKDVIEMNRRLSGDVSLNVPLNKDSDSVEWQDRLIDEASDQEALFAESEESENRRRALGVALRVLNDRERRIFEARRLIERPRSLEELAIEFRISRERVRQIEATAFEKVQRRMLRASGARLH
jgi:RNA polymerase sigma-32 factor